MDRAQETAEAPVPAARRKFWGWGLEDEGLTPATSRSWARPLRGGSALMACACRSRRR